MNSRNPESQSPGSFQGFLKNLNLINSSLIAGTVIVPVLAGKLMDFSPPGYESPGLLIVVQFLIFLASFLFFNESRKSSLRRISIISSSLCLCMLLIYLSSLEAFTYRPMPSGIRIVKGKELASDAPEILERGQCPKFEFSACSLELYGTNYSLMWKDYEATSSRRKLILSTIWIFTFALLALGVATFALTI